jgi:ubiquitin-protein ligase
MQHFICNPILTPNTSITYEDIYVHTDVRKDGILVYILGGEFFADRVFKIFIKNIHDSYFYCENNEAWHPNIEYKQINSIDHARIDTTDLANTSDLNSTLLSLRYLIQNPNPSNPFNIDASVSYCKDRSKFTEKHCRLKKTEFNPFGEIEYVIKKIN